MGEQLEDVVVVAQVYPGRVDETDLHVPRVAVRAGGDKARGPAAWVRRQATALV